ncbi:MAG: HMA2 domain-containing protein [Bacillus sp. (in: firmicutes)]
MNTAFTVIHSIPGRIRLHLPTLAKQKDVSSIEKIFESIEAIKTAKIQPITKSMVLYYDKHKMNEIDIFRYVNLYFSVDRTTPAVPVKKDMRKEINHSILSGGLLLASYWRKNAAVNTTIFDYLMVMTTSYTVASRSENRMTQPDLIKALVAMVSSGTGGTLQAALVTYILNILQVLGNARMQARLPYVY